MALTESLSEVSCEHVLAKEGIAIWAQDLLGEEAAAAEVTDDVVILVAASSAFAMLASATTILVVGPCLRWRVLHSEELPARLLADELGDLAVVQDVQR